MTSAMIRFSLSGVAFEGISDILLLGYDFFSDQDWLSAVEPSTQTLQRYSVPILSRDRRRIAR